MHKTIALVAGALMGLAAYGAPVFAADVGVSTSVGDPDFYGRIDIGGYPRPRVYYAEPMFIEQGARYQEPVYLHVRPGHARRWKKHCHEYGACGQRVYFVNDNWYKTVYVPHYRERYGHRDAGQQDHRDGRDRRQGAGHDDRQGEHGRNENGPRGDHREQYGNRQNHD